MKYEKYIYCLEGDWDTDLKGKSSILPALELLTLNCNIKTIYRTCSTKEELVNRINQLLNAPVRYEKYQIIYLAFHGFEGGISFGGKTFITLDELAAIYEGKFKNKIIHFGSCSTLYLHDDDIKYFKKKTKALCVSGYQNDIKFISSTVVDVLYFELCQSYKNLTTIKKQMFENYGELCDKLEFRMY